MNAPLVSFCGLAALNGIVLSAFGHPFTTLGYWALTAMFIASYMCGVWVGRRP